jgi:anti-sigma B factor antagonist
MFDIKIQNGKDIFLSGRFDASQIDKANNILNQVNQNCTIDFKDLDYISSAGLGILIKTYSRLKDEGYNLKLMNMSKHVKEVFKYSALDKVFIIE